MSDVCFSERARLLPSTAAPVSIEATTRDSSEEGSARATLAMVTNQRLQEPEVRLRMYLVFLSVDDGAP